MSVFVSVSVYLCLPLSAPVSLSFSLSVCLYLYLSLCLSMSVCLSVSSPLSPTAGSNPFFGQASICLHLTCLTILHFDKRAINLAPKTSAVRLFIFSADFYCALHRYLFQMIPADRRTTEEALSKYAITTFTL